MKKNNTLRWILSAVFMLLSATLSWAYDFEVDGIFYNVNKDGESVSVTYKNLAFKHYEGSVSIPPQVTNMGKTYRVTCIGEGAFNRCPSLTSVEIPNSITSIENYVFMEGILDKIDIPSSVTSIGNKAFYDCEIKSITYNSENVPELFSNSWLPEYAMVYVPVAAVEKYKTAVPEKSFWICGIEEKEALANLSDTAIKIPGMFKGGQEAMKKFLGENIKYPKTCEENGIQGSVLVQFIVNTDGTIFAPKILRSVYPDLDREAMRVVILTNGMWTPAISFEDTPVRMKFILPITFRLR